MCANCTRCSARASAFAPASSSTDGRSRAGIGTAIAGRRTPGRRRRCRRPAASTAPVFPAETTASASPEATARTAATRLESGFARTASAGFSAMSIRSAAATSGRPCVSSVARPVQRHLDAVGGGGQRAQQRPRAVRCRPRERRRRSAASRVSLRRVEAERLDLAALVGAAGRADAVRPLRRAALRAGVDPRRLDRVLCTALVAAGLRRFPLRNCHRAGAV